MRRQLPVIVRALVLMCATLLLGTAFAQEPLTLPDAPGSGFSAPAQEPQPTAEAQIVPDNGLGRFNLDSPDVPAAPFSSRETMSRLTFDSARLDGGLADAVGRFARGDLLGADEAARGLWLPRDKRGRYLVVLWAAEGVRGARVGRLAENVGGKLEYTEGKAAYARLDALQIAQLSTDARIAMIQPQPVGRADPEPTSTAGTRDPAGATFSEGFDIANALSWHNDGNTGDSVKIGLIDFGFGEPGVGANDELTCLNSYPNVNLAFGTAASGDTRRGLDMAEVICDIAPDARVRLYRVTNSNTLYDAIGSADNVNDVIVIGAEFGVNFSPGDGAFGRSSSKDVYEALATARANGVVVLAAAGNTHQAYRAFRYVSGATTIPMKVKPGDLVNISWNDWPQAPNGGGAQEDFAVSLAGAGFSTINKPVRTPGGLPTHQFTVPSCTTGDGGLCDVTLTVGSGTGDADDVVQVNITGGFDRSIGTITGANQIFEDAGTLSRPADSQHVIAVGAVCSSFHTNYPRAAYSGIGPVYAPGGDFDGAPSGELWAGQVKPDIVGPSNVSVEANPVSNIIECADGLRGTQASAAHAAAMTALLLNNEAVSGFNGLSAPANILHYFRTHSVDMPLAAHDINVLDLPLGNGYDQYFGAGLAVLGQPDYDYDRMLTAPLFAPPNRIPAGENCTAGIRYVGPRNAGSSDMDGSIANPYQSIMQAAYLQNAEATQGYCVVVLPGEYVAPVLLSGLDNNIGIFGYSGVTLQGGIEPTTIVVQNKYWEAGTPFGVDPRRAAIYVYNAAGIDPSLGTTVGGFDFVAGDVFADSDFLRPQILAVHNSNGFQFIRSNLRDIVSNLTLVEVIAGSSNAVLSDNTFTNNTGLAGASLIGVVQSGINVGRVVVRDSIFEGNSTMDGGWDPEIGLTINWVPMIRSFESYTDIVNNVMRKNKTEVLIQGVTSEADMPYELRIIGNVMVGNIIDSTDFPQPPGPLIHGFFQRYIMIVNNTIAATRFENTVFPFDTLFGRGDDNPINGGAADSGSLNESLARWEIRGNLLIDNESSTIVKEVDPGFASGGGCLSFNGSLNQGAQDNRYSDTGLPENCSAAFANVSLGNFEIDPVGLINGGPDDTQPEYYAPKEGLPGLIDDGPDDFVDSQLAFFAVGQDVRGNARIAGGVIDVGAYEFTTFELVPVITRTADEDSGAIEFDINDTLYLNGGYPPFTASVEAAPSFFGMHCDPRFASVAAQGAAVELINASTLTVAYCPPQNFHTDTDDPDFLNATVDGCPGLFGAVMKVELTDAAGSTGTTCIQYHIDPVDDPDLSTSQQFTGAVGHTQSAAQNAVRMRPYVDFSNDLELGGSDFRFSEAANPFGTAAQEADYDFVYPSLPTLVADPGNVNPAEIVNKLVWVDQSKGIFGVNLTDVSPDATAKLQYTVQDSNGGSTTNFVTLSAVAPPGPFDLLTPPDDFVIANLDSFASLSWEVSANATTYDIVVARKINPPYIEVVRLEGRTPTDSDSDNLSCTATVCTLMLTDAQKQVFTTAEYRWRVYADNQGLKRQATLAFDFTVQAGRELLLNGGFEVQGTNTKLAADWSLKKGTKDERKCTGGFESPCMFQFSANTSTVATMKQKPGAIGRAGDMLTFSAWIASSKLGTNVGILTAVVKYANGEKDKITITAPTGTHDFTPRLAAPTPLRFTVSKYVVKLQVKKGKGKMMLDNVSLSLDEKVGFNLLTPTDDGTVVADPSTITELTWQPSASAAAYTVTLLRTLDPGNPVYDDSFTSAADGDDLTCVGGLCVFELDGPLADGDYVWSVTASNGTVASNEPFNLTVDSADLAELVDNGGFEANSSKNLPTGWKAKNVKSSVSVCESGTIHPEYQGECAFRFVGASGLNAKLEQTLDVGGLEPNDRLTLRASAEMGKAVSGLDIKLTVTYENGTKGTRRITLPGNSRPWQSYSDEVLTIGGDVKKAKLSISYKGSSGYVTLDNVSVIRERDEAP